MARYRAKRRRWSATDLAVVGAAVLAVGTWWVFLRDTTPEPVEGTIPVTRRTPLASNRPEVEPASPPRADVAEKGDAPTPAGADKPADSNGKRVASLIASGKQALEKGELVAARAYLSEALQLGIEDEDQRTLVRAELTRIGNETIFSRRIFDGDPLVSRYVVKAGDTLGKIAKAHKVSADLLADVNGLRDKNMIRLGQNLKVVHGPFRAVVHKDSYTMDVFLENTLVKHFRVGLGYEGSTPTGEWRVGTKLKNPTYYPPRGGQIVAADDPENPLGERWIGLVGVAGEAVGQQRYGIHGTIEPESIGQSVSLGCIRLHNEDVELLYKYLVPEHSTVIVMSD